MFVFLSILVLGYFRYTVSGYVEIVEITGCHTCRLMLTCRSLNSIIAILDYNFVEDIVDESANAGDLAGNSSISFAPAYPRDILNQRCSGLNLCSFILSEDCPGSDIFGPGNITIKYACVTDRIKKYCNSDIVLPSEYTKDGSEGFIHNPGYPRFYSGHKDCRWRITGNAEQRIRVTILDISLIVDNVECTDVLEIRDTGQVIHSACRQQHPPTEIVSGSESIEVVLSSRQEFNPRRGFLIYYSVVGCSELPTPQGAYIVHRTPFLTVFSCCRGYNFPDTGTRIKSIGCLGSFWNTSLPLLDCQKSSSPLHWNLTRNLENIKPGNFRNMSSELIVPIMVILVLFVVNAVVVFFIHKERKKQETLNSITEEHLRTFTSSPDEI
ncbi:uncharacterized protein isoform X2 [Leptinotarsa decemlineata]|uniref:uncharacterized protein isoform X2 n=1 Tax=Leptinotarsa decemlineata TaxID=7539 RepID=UPI003D30B901